MERLLPIILLAMSIAFISNTYTVDHTFNFNCVKGQGNEIKKTIDLDAFEGINVLGNSTVYIEQGPKQKVEVEGQENVINLLKTEIKDGVWQVGFQKCTKNTKKLTIYITIPEIKYIAITGSGDIINRKEIKSDELKLKVQGSGDIELEVDAASITSSITGSGSIQADGKSDDLSLKITGSGSFNGDDFTTKSAKIKITGSGKSHLEVKEKLDARITGSGDIHVEGNPHINAQTTGSGRVRE